MTKMMIAAAAVALTMPVAAFAQAPLALAEQDRVVLEQRAATVVRSKIAGSVETRVTPGRPYSAEAITESLQVLGDGNRIQRRTATRVFRDGEGRTRREHLGAGAAPESIAINDHVAHMSFTLDPATRTAVETPLRVLLSTMATTSGGGGMARVAAPTTVEEGRRREVETAARVELATTSREASGQMKQVLERAASGGGATTRENLGRQQIEGVMATGTSATTIIPAGAIGNTQEIRIVSEQWFSPDLEVLVLTKHSDPRVGETVYRLTNIVRAEPDPALFAVPGDYTVKQRGK